MFRLSKKMSSRMRTTILLAALVIVIYFYKDVIDHSITRRQLDVSKDVNQTDPPPTNSSYVYSWPRCERNMSSTKIRNFTQLPEIIQNVFYYRHCRHFPMLLDVPDKCGGVNGSADVFLLLIIKSSPENYDRREILRKTWAGEKLHNGVWIRRLFIVGSRNAGFDKVRLDKGLELEQREYNDILQWDFNDTFYNLTVKQILFLEWKERHCPHARFLLNGDDDVFASTNNMVDYLQSLKDNTGNKHLFAGDLIENVGPIRKPDNKYFIPVELQQSDLYPPYCGGGGFLLSSYTASVIYNMSHSITLFPIDDVYFGLCMAEAGIGPISHKGMKTGGLIMPFRGIDRYDPCYYRDVLLVHRFLSAKLYYMWNQVNDPNLDCSLEI
ncbi:N-acetyllactosaminide beta-1,3-N-acetylglucosaminyltransferase 3-like [Anoplopoma fimbria]|uniref:N-acetyllactosaminide beta-1,3-N-acetylglucosaminyltransferase 3-like n=1 Tax=Anoplopoma fimbria TaxID=229290 RepID=UPI0023EDDB07|nr:N-acetyllactosaminide beta-1,3-N-acetylglucosaminyltransferase 3-like [Anoplopoma fimbria]